jgi:catechol 2,3-dioxygenase-like lactoylglutathione lyase family enzyme
MTRSRRRSRQVGPSRLIYVQHDDANAALRQELSGRPADARSAAGEDHPPSLDVRHRCERSTRRDRHLGLRESSTLLAMNSSQRARPVAFGHIGLHVSEMERSIRFYRDVVGLEEVERRGRDDAYLGVLTGYPGLRMDTCLLVESASGLMIELLVVLSASGRPVEPATANPGTAHICFVVDDVDAIYRRAIESGHEAVNEPVTPTAGRWKNGRSVYLLDPDRIRVELVQPG